MIVVNAFIKNSINRMVVQLGIGVARRLKGPCPPNIFRKYSHLCFERPFSKQNSVIRLKSNILAPPKFLGWLCHCSLAIVPLNEVVHRNNRQT